MPLFELTLNSEAEFVSLLFSSSLVADGFEMGFVGGDEEVGFGLPFDVEPVELECSVDPLLGLFGDAEVDNVAGISMVLFFDLIS